MSCHGERRETGASASSLWGAGGQSVCSLGGVFGTSGCGAIEVHFSEGVGFESFGTIVRRGGGVVWGREGWGVPGASLWGCVAVGAIGGADGDSSGFGGGFRGRLWGRRRDHDARPVWVVDGI